MLIAASDDGKNRRPAAALMFGPDARAATVGSGSPLKYISSCEIDLNNDGESDIGCWWRR